ncbi:hypothetical protein HZS_2361 [Henneguya salminicola]|nr:hypothetical protein HZS_2361 [Henneguya salminicola]
MKMGKKGGNNKNIVKNSSGRRALQKLPLPYTSNFHLYQPETVHKPKRKERRAYKYFYKSKMILFKRILLLSAIIFLTFLYFPWHFVLGQNDTPFFVYQKSVKNSINEKLTELNQLYFLPVWREYISTGIVYACERVIAKFYSLDLYLCEFYRKFSCFYL